MSHYRVIPRDFFNEAKLLKCLGRFELCIHHTREIPREFDFEKLKVEFDYHPFDIEQNEADGSLWVTNYKVTLDGDPLHLYTPYNSKSNWPLCADFRGDTYYVFNEEGEFMPNFGVIKHD